MFDSEALELIKRYSNYKLELPPVLTNEELLLKSKYEVLKKAKQQLTRHKTKSSAKSSSNKCIIPKAANVKKDKENKLKKSSDLKKWSKQRQENDFKRTYPTHSFKEDTEPRTVRVRGEGLTEEYIQQHFNEFGSIWKIKTNENNTSSVLTFMHPTSAVKSVEVLNGTVIDGVKLHVSILRKNTIWSTTDDNTNRLARITNRERSVHLSYKGRLGAADFENFFQNVGRISRIYLNEPNHFGFVTFENEEQAQKAVKMMDGKIHNGIKVYVSPQRLPNNTYTKSPSQEISQHWERQMISYDTVLDSQEPLSAATSVKALNEGITGDVKLDVSALHINTSCTMDNNSNLVEHISK